MVFTLLNIRGTCNTLPQASDCRIEELPNLVASPLEVAKFMNLLFIHWKPDILFLRGIRTMFVGDNYFKGLKLVEEALKATNIKGTNVFYILELLNGSHLEFDDVEWVFKFLGPLKDNEDMMWIRQKTIRQFGREWNDEGKLEVSADDWLGFHGNCKLTEVPRFNSD
ncbi:hypothetical protein CJ030_MR2G022354 [Morella rubra]|uniref:Uncharacterized protein n=1 Tax=Morella rubra TaxID=262757 RepID=A0A6A1WDW7_9ROSI|nr:hypothetical protein CJ030_MR2G022354 [Morella rubra]